MRKYTPYPLLVVFLYATVLFSCKKQDIDRSLEQESPAMLNKVNSWLDEQAKKFSKEASRYEITRLKKSLIGSQLKVEEISSGEKLIMIPLPDTFRTQFQRSQPSLKMLVVRQLNNNLLVAGQIVEMVPNGQRYEKIPDGLIGKVDRNESNELNGVIRMLSISNKLLAEKEFRQGQLNSISRISKKKNLQNEKNSRQLSVEYVKPIEECTDWYFVTTYYYADGTYEEVWQYLYTTCGDGGGGGGGGGSNDPSDNTYEVDYTDVSSEDDIPGGETPDGEFGAAPRITYYHDFTLMTVNDEVVNVIRYPVRAQPMIANYITGGWNATRTLTLLNQYNSWTPLGPTHGMVTWNWSVIGHYVYKSGGLTETRTRQWARTHTKVY